MVQQLKPEIQNHFQNPTGLRHKELRKLSDQRVLRQNLLKHILPLLYLFVYFRHAAEHEDWIICFRQGLHLTEQKRSHPSSDTRRQLGVFKVPYLVTGLFLAGKWRGAWACLSVMEYSCLHLCFMPTCDALILISLSHIYTHTHTRMCARCSPHHLWLFGFQDISLAAEKSTAPQLEAIRLR